MLFQIQTDMDTMMTVAQDSLTVMEQPIEESINLFTMAQYGGWIMIVLLLLLAFALYLFVERLVVLTKATREDKTFMNRIRDFIKEGNIDSATKLCKRTNTPSARMVEKGITRIGRPMQDVQVAIDLGRSFSVTVTRFTPPSNRRISILRQMDPSRRSSKRTPDSRV